jgi:hypothetical protein
MVPKLKILMFSGSKKGTQIYLFFSLKKSWLTNPLQVPQQGPYGERDPFAGHFCIYLEILVKIPLNKIFFFFLSKAPRKEGLSMFPQSGALCKQTPIPEP